MRVLRNIGYLASCRDEGEQGDIHPIHSAAVAWENGIIQWVGREKELPQEYSDAKSYDARGMMVIPGLVDCHTHLAFGGWRPEEFAMRLRGRSYLEIGKSGGGIISTVEATRAAGSDELFEKTTSFLSEMLDMGITTVECKSGYGLSTEEEIKLLKVYHRLGDTQKVNVVPTFMGAHTVPPEYSSNREDYIELVVEEMIPAVAEERLAEFCDIFTEESAFSVEESRRILVAAQAAGLAPKVHADQLTSCGGAELAAEVEAASADHLEKISEAGIEQMAKAGVVGVTLPLASLYTQQEPLDCRKLVEGGVEVAVATDFNPGSAPTYELPLAMMLACNQGRLTPAQALKGATLYAAKAIHRDLRTGSVEKGKNADLAIIDAPNPDFWMYYYRGSRCRGVFVKGEKVR